ncbi:hypothetical protein D3C81_2188630 [compost metagenome]
MIDFARRLLPVGLLNFSDGVAGLVTHHAVCGSNFIAILLEDELDVTNGLLHID